MTARVAENRASSVCGTYARFGTRLSAIWMLVRAWVHNTAAFACHLQLLPAGSFSMLDTPVCSIPSAQRCERFIGMIRFSDED